MSKIITCEQVSNGHPDKICDQIADAIVTDILQHDKNARVAIECLLKRSQLFIAGEVTTDYQPNYQQIVHEVITRIGADKMGFDFRELLRIGILVDKQYLLHLPDSASAHRTVGSECPDGGRGKKKLRKSERVMTTPLFMLRCVQLGISIADLDLLTIGLVNDMFTERQNDEYPYQELASQADFDRF